MTRERLQCSGLLTLELVNIYAQLMLCHRTLWMESPHVQISD